MAVTIRPFEVRDYPAVALVGNLVFPEYPSTPEEIRFRDEHRDGHCRFRRWVAESAEGIVANAIYEQFAAMYHPRRFHLGIEVRPDRRRQGIGTLLYEQILDALSSFQPLTLRAMAREDMGHSLEFLRRRGFVEELRSWESRLDVAAFDFSRFREAEEALAAQGIEIRTLRELEADPEGERKLFELSCQVEADMPAPELFTRPDFDTWVTRLRESPNLLPDGFFIAVRGSEYIGLSTLWTSRASDDLHTGDTGVLRLYRRRGIATALKLRAIRHARETGKPMIKTWNDTTNRAMLSINERLGYVKQPVWIHLVKTFEDAD